MTQKPVTKGATDKAPNTTVQQKITQVEVKATVEYHLYPDGKIKYKLIDNTGDDKKRTVKALKDARKKAKYIYHDAAGTEHDLGTYNITVVSNKYKGYGDKLGGKKIYLMKMSNVNNYANGNVKFSISINTSRYYANDVTTASLLGAMLNCSYTDFNFNGGSNAKGETVDGSKSHKNGQNLDLRYLRTDKSGKNIHLNINPETGDPCGWKGLDVERQNKFIEELNRFGWANILGWEYWNSANGSDSATLTSTAWNTWSAEWLKNNPGKKAAPVLKNITHKEAHHHHFHLESYSPSLKDITND